MTRSQHKMADDLNLVRIFSSVYDSMAVTLNSLELNAHETLSRQTTHVSTHLVKRKVV
jgi:hypothetical protein